MEHFILIRFSTRFSSSPEFEKKINKLFDENRLDFRFYLFENFCLKSLVNQTLIDFKVIIIYDQNLPTKYKNKLIELIKNYNFIILHKWNLSDSLTSNKWLIQYLPKNYNNYIITTRMDDDDMINYNLNYKLKNYIKKYSCLNNMISFKGGNFLNYFSKDKMILVPINYSSLGIYLTKIHKINDGNVYNHIHHKHSLQKKIIKFNNAFIVVNHIYENDNRLERFNKRKGQLVNMDDIIKCIS